MSSERLHALDALRAYALLAGIVLHATMTFFINVPAADVSQSQFLALVFFVIHIFRMGLFYVIAGFFAALALERKGTYGFSLDRVRRILVPMLIGWLVLVPLTGPLVLWGLHRTYGNNLPPLIADATAVFPLMHLWFLYYLLWFYAALLLWRALLKRLPTTISEQLARLGVLATSWWGPVLLALPGMAMLLSFSNWNPWFGIPTPDQGLELQGASTVIYACCFSIGVLVHRQRAALAYWQLQRHWLTLAGAACTALCLMLVGSRAELLDPHYFEQAPWQRALYAFSYCAALWYWSFGLIGQALHYCNNHSPLRRYLADASYWLYLSHIPLVFALQILMMNLPWSWLIKFPVIVILTVLPLLWVYDKWIRPGRIGAALNGRRLPSALPRAPSSKHKPA